MAYKYAKKKKEKRSQNWLERAAPSSLHKLPLIAKEKFQTKGNLTPNQRMRKLTDSFPNSLIKSPN